MYVRAVLVLDSSNFCGISHSSATCIDYYIQNSYIELLTNTWIWGPPVETWKQFPGQITRSFECIWANAIFIVFQALLFPFSHASAIRRVIGVYKVWLQVRFVPHIWIIVVRYHYQRTHRGYLAFWVWKFAVIQKLRTQNPGWRRGRKCGIQRWRSKYRMVPNKRACSNKRSDRFKGSFYANTPGAFIRHFTVVPPLRFKMV